MEAIGREGLGNDAVAAAGIGKDEVVARPGVVYEGRAVREVHAISLILDVVAVERAARDAKADSESFRRRILFRTTGTNIEAVENRRLYRDTHEGAQPTPR